MEERICTRCGTRAYSADSKGDWECVNPNCRQIIKPNNTGIEEKTKELHRIWFEDQDDFA